MDEDGNIVKRYRFDPWGNLEAQWGAEPNHYLFTGKEKDGSGFYYFGARYYNPRLGRFVTPDPQLLNPLALNLKDPQTLNLYSYVANNPLRYKDPNGLWRDDIHAQNFIAIAEGFIGTPYGQGVGKVDCSGLVKITLFKMMKEEHIVTELALHWEKLPIEMEVDRMSTAILRAAEAGKYGLEIIPTSEMKPGDLLVTEGHVEIIRSIDEKTGKITTIAASETAGKVIIRKEFNPWSSGSWWQIQLSPPRVVRISEEWSAEAIYKEKYGGITE